MSEFKTLSNISSSSFVAGSLNPLNYGKPNITNLTLTKEKNEKTIEFTLLPWTTVEAVNVSPFISLNFSESMFNTAMYGSLVFNDYRNWADEFTFTGKEKIKLTLKIPTHKEDEESKELKFEFHIYDAKRISDESDFSSTVQGNERISLWRIYFVSSEVFLSNYNKSFLEENLDFVGLIAKEKEDKKPAIINQIFKNFNLKPYKIDKTKNGIWFKNNHISYPWMKRRGQLQLSQLLSYVTEFAVNDKNNPFYFCWHDRNGWNFRDISKVTNPDEVKVDPTDGFIFSIDETSPNRILALKVLEEYNIEKLLDTGSLFSGYVRYEPNWSNSYLDFLDNREGLTQIEIKYEYPEKSLIEKYPLISKKDKNILAKATTAKGLLKPVAKTDDMIYGYFNKNFLNNPFFEGKVHGGQWDVYGNTMSGSWSVKTWQPQYDISNLKFSDFETIYNKVRKPLLNKRDEYSRKKNIKRKWEVYRCSVCCHENGPYGSTSDILLSQNPGPIDGFTFNALFGPTGVFADLDQTYKLSAAGSFTDLLNFDAGNTFIERGLTYSYDLTKEPYNQTIGQFFNLLGPDAPQSYIQNVIQRALGQYDILITQINTRIAAIDSFISNVSSYKQVADQIYSKALIDKLGSPKRDIYAPSERPIDLIQGYKFVGDAIPGEVVTSWPITEYEFGLVPHTKIPTNKGIGQIVFEAGVGCEGTRIETSSPGGGGSSSGGGGSSSGGGGSSSGGGGSSSGGGGSSSGGGGSSTGPSLPTCYPITVQGTIRHPDKLINYYDRSVFGDGIINVFYSLGSGSDYVAGVEVPDSIKIYYPVTNTGGYTEDQLVAFTINEEGEYVLGSGLLDFVYTPSRNIEGNLDYNKFAIELRPQPPLPDNPVITSSIFYIIDCQAGLPTVSGPQGSRGPTGPTGPQGPTGATGPSALPVQEDIIKFDPNCFAACSNDKAVRGFIRHTTVNSAQTYGEIYLYAAPYLWDESGPKGDWSFFDYGTESGLIPGIVDSEIRARTQSCLLNSGCINTTCLSSTALEVLRRTLIAEKQLLSVELELLQQLRGMVVNYQTIWSNHYSEWYNRNAFFFSKKPGKSIFKTSERETLKSPISLQNIKKITRKEVRGSRYELFARARGITGASAGEWLYNVFFENDPGNTAHPYYSQGYNLHETNDNEGIPGSGRTSFISSRKPHKWFGYSDSDNTNDPTSFIDDTGFGEYGPQYRKTDSLSGEFVETSALHVGFNDLQNLTSSQGFRAFGYAQSDLDTIGNSATYRQTFNFYDTNDKKPPNIKKEEITSYVRVEFETPIGLDRIKEFPDGFVRDAGIEYFLPYIVQLTPGPMGRQGVKYNSAVIGMDPYGFDVAVKKIKDDLPTNRKLQGIDKGNYYNWWNHDTGTVLSKSIYLTSDYNGMDLWPESGFVTDMPYYSYDASQEDLHGGGYDMDFHMGGAYYFENNSQNWTESLYHYGISSKKQFDPLYRSSVVGSYILPNSYRKLKPHRSWWSMFVPRNLFIPLRFANMLKTPNTKARDLFGGKAILSLSSNYWRTWYGSEFDDWTALSENARELLSGNDLTFFLDDKEPGNVIDVHNTSLGGYFKDSLMHYLTGTYTLYNPSNSPLIVEDLWKYDLSGETEYGLITPPVDSEYEFFDRNFAMQFTVFARGSRTCDDLGLKCLNPNGIVKSSGGCTADPYCDCPALNKIPTEPEPTYLELWNLQNEINECALIKEYLGEKWLGCEWSDPTSTCSCNCPEQGEFFDKYLAYTRLYSTFWETEFDVPLKRNAFVNQLQAQKISIAIPPNHKINVGSIVEIIDENDLPNETKKQYKKISGRWMVSSIEHNMLQTFTYYMILTLVRDGLHYDPDEEQKPTAILGNSGE